MKIVQFITRMDVLGGAQIHVFDLTRALINRGHEVIVLSSGFGKLPEELKKHGIEYYQLSQLTVPIHPVKDVKALFEAKKTLKKLNPDLIAIHSSKAGIIGRIVGKMLKIPTVFTAHSWSFSSSSNKLKKRIFIMIERLIGTLSTGIITVSHYDYEAAKKYNIAQQINIKVIHNGIKEREKKSVQYDQKENIKLLMIARFAYPKDHKLLFKALKDIPIRNWRLTLIGDGPLLHDTKEYAHEYNLENYIFFTGESRDVEAYLDKTDIFLLITKSEGLPISIIEAMRAELPIIASDVGGVKELIDHNKSGLLVKRNGLKELRSAIMTLLSNKQTRIQLGKEARKKYEQHFTFSTMLIQTENYYKEICLRKNKKQGVEII